MRLNNRMKRSNTDTTANTDNCAFFLYVCRISKRAKDCAKLIAYVFARKLKCGCADSLKNKDNPAFVSVCVCNCKRNAFPKINIELNKDKLTGFAIPGDVWSIYFEVKNVGRKLPRKSRNRFSLSPDETFSETISTRIGIRGILKSVTEPSPISEKITEDSIISKNVSKNVLIIIFSLSSWNTATDMLKKSRAGRIYLPKRIVISETIFRNSEEFNESAGKTNVAIIPNAQPIKYFDQIFRLLTLLLCCVSILEV